MINIFILTLIWITQSIFITSITSKTQKQTSMLDLRGFCGYFVVGDNYWQCWGLWGAAGGNVGWIEMVENGLDNALAATRTK